MLNLKSDDLGINTDLYGLIIRDLNLLLAIYPRNKNLLTALAAAASKSDQKMVDGLFAFRREKQEMSISERVINNLELVLTNNCLGIESNKANLLLTRMEREKLWVDVNSERYRRRRTSPSGFGSASYAKIENLITRARDDLAKGRYCGVAGKGALNSKLIYEVW